MAVGIAAALLALAVTLATPYLRLPVGTATATGTSMGYEGMQVVGYVDRPAAAVDIGQTVIYRDGDRLVHHRVVGRTERGLVTRGDAVVATDQALGAPYVTDRNLLGVVVVRLPLRVATGVAAVLAGGWVALGWRLVASRGRPDRA